MPGLLPAVPGVGEAGIPVVCEASAFLAASIERNPLVAALIDAAPPTDGEGDTHQRPASLPPLARAKEAFEEVARRRRAARGGVKEEAGDLLKMNADEFVSFFGEGSGGEGGGEGEAQGEAESHLRQLFMRIDANSDVRNPHIPHLTPLTPLTVTLSHLSPLLPLTPYRVM